MRKIFFALLLITSISQAQYRLRYDKLFVEAGIGLAVPLSNISPEGGGNSLSMTHAQGSLRYMFSENVGLLGSLSYDQFTKKIERQTDQKLATLEICYNLGNVIELSRSTGGQFGLLVHAGGGIGQLSSEYDYSDLIGAVIIGAKPYIAINEKVSFFADLSYKAILEQNVYYNGLKTAHSSSNPLTSSQLGLTFGFIVALGQNRFHADSAY
ncbi:outer membrane beta-barrel protein [Flavobacterium flavigenum]|uniref:outer membrane beta-barrel protein n=1 Tax=Flavobacterium flavigenum TaxID=3003258 RepID=UPI0022ABCADF|nr:outer membrane beta-barrel protein [Flavobacterium flavigenum]